MAKITKKIFIIAGEASGDALGASIMAEMKLHNPEVKFIGVGGEKMSKQGLTSLFPMSDLAVMGIAEILPHLPKLLKRISQTVKAIIAEKPDMVLTIDAPGFCFRVQKKIRALLGKDAPYLMHFVAPSVWAWKPKRAQKIAAYLDGLMTLLPFEPPYFTKHKLTTDFVGHPILTTGADQGRADHFRKKHKIRKEDILIVLLPGSRLGEINRHMPIFAEVASRLWQENPDIRFVLPTIAAMQPYVEDQVQHWAHQPIVTVDIQEKWDAFAAAKLAVAASGSVTLELAVAGVPMIVAYQVNALTALMVRRMLQINTVTLVNLLLDKQVVPEFLQEDCTAPNIKAAVVDLLDHPKKMDAQKKSFLKAIQLLKPDQGTSPQKAVQVICKALKIG